MASTPRSLDAAEYTIGWICALTIEMAASVAQMDELYDPPIRPLRDQNSYRFGRIGPHNIVLACLPAGLTGTSSAATVAAQVRSTFPSIQFGLLVGVGGGAPSEKADIRLGDIVVSKPNGTSGGVIQYDFGKTVGDRKFTQTLSLNKPPMLLLNALASFETQCLLDGNSISKTFLKIPAKYPDLRSAAVCPGPEDDRLFKAGYDHEGDSDSCTSCDLRNLIERPLREDQAPRIHFGAIASANQVMRHGTTRDRLAKELNVLCFEMEAAGLMDNFPCLVIRGICDYADSHKSKRWQPFAAITSAACAKQILLLTPPTTENRTETNIPTLPESTRLPSILNGCFKQPRNPRFSGRLMELAALDAWYSRPSDASESSDSQSRIVIHGLGGVGKTQLLTEWCHDISKKQHASIFWFNAGTLEELMAQYRHQAQRLRGLRDKEPSMRAFVDKTGIAGDDTDLVKAWIEACGSWVLALDNYDTISVDVEPFIPRGLGKVIFTSRDKRAIGTVSNEGFELKSPATLEAELVFLRQHTPGTTITEETLETHPEHAETREIVSNLHRFPLALSQAAAYIRESQPFTCTEYLELLRARQDREVLLRFKEVRPEYPKSVMTTWEISMDLLRTKYPKAAKLLQLLGFFARSGVSEEILLGSTRDQRWSFGTCTTTRQLSAAMREKLDFLSSKARFIVHLGILINLALVSKSSDRIVAVHPLVHEWIQARLATKPQESVRFAHLCGLITYQAYPLEYVASYDISKSTDLQQFPAHLSEITRALRQSDCGSGSIPLEVRTLFLATLLWEIPYSPEYLSSEGLVSLVATCSSDAGPNEEPLVAIQPQIFQIISNARSLGQANVWIQMMDIVHTRLSSYSQAPLWVLSQRIYMVVLTTLILKLVEIREFHVLEQPRDMLIEENNIREKINSTLCGILTFLSLGEGSAHNEISFLKVRVKLVLAKILTLTEYKYLPTQFFRDGVSLEQVNCVDVRMAIKYFTEYVKFNQHRPGPVTRAMELSRKVIQQCWRQEYGRARDSALSTSRSFLSSSFGRDVSFFIESARQIHLDGEDIMYLRNASSQCIQALLDRVSAPSARTVEQKAISPTFRKILNAVEELEFDLQSFEHLLLSGREWDSSQSVMQGYQFHRLLAQAHFFNADLPQTIQNLQTIFKAEEVLAKFGTNANVQQLIYRGNTASNVLDPALIVLRRGLREKKIDLAHRPGLSIARDWDPFTSSAESIPLGTGVTSALARWYKETAIPAPTEDIRYLLQMWVTCLVRLHLIDENQESAWRKECAAISGASDFEILILTHQLTIASRSCAPLKTSEWRRQRLLSIAMGVEEPKTGELRQRGSFSVSSDPPKDESLFTMDDID